MIREAMERDIPGMLEIYSYYVENTAVSFEYTLPTVEEFARRLEEHKEVYPWLVWEEKGEILGYAYAGRAFERAAYSWNAEISCYLKVRGKGMGRKLYEIIEGILKAQGVRKVYAVVTSANEPSVAFHKAVGYKEVLTYQDVGFKFGQWYDVIWLEKQLLPLGKPENFPIPWEKIKTTLDI
ncbi:MAG: N-acetyltransferase [Oscillospiraceae bacterium]|nr:N-acetyltransferase [Oscillospiraceae bacterium]